LWSGAVEIAHRQLMGRGFHDTDAAHAFGSFRHFAREAVVKRLLCFLRHLSTSTSSPCSTAFLIVAASAESHEAAKRRSTFNWRSSRLSCAFLAKPNRNTAKSPARTAIITRYPPRRPWPFRATRCLALRQDRRPPTPVSPARRHPTGFGRRSF